MYQTHYLIMFILLLFYHTLIQLYIIFYLYYIICIKQIVIDGVRIIAQEIFFHLSY